ncbi:MAG: hypothetical protein IJX06_00350 [Clostridia bacterium]|nr:hypothetical protein [Clostridia bacterium]
MRKKLISIILTVIMCFTLFTGCTLFQYDAERDYKQVIATIKPVTITDGSGESKKTFTSKEKYVYKYDLVNSMNNSLALLVNNYGMTVEAAVDYLYEQLIVRELVLNEADAQIAFGNIIWGQNEKNQVQQGIYATIDNQLATIRGEILTEHGDPVPSGSGSETTETETETTYPTEEVEEPGLYDELSRNELINAVVDAGLAVRDRAEEYSNSKLIAILEKADLDNVEPWTPDTVRYPGLYGSDDVKSLEIEAMTRFMAILRENVTENYRLTDEQKSTFSAEIRQLTTIANTQGVPYVYPELGKTELMHYLVGRDYENNIKLTLLQDTIVSGVDVTETEVLEEYNNMLKAQQNKYANVDSFYSDVKGGSVDPLLYYPNGSYYYVKHILIPFTDAQTKELEAFKTNYGTILGDEAIVEKKEALGKAVVGFEHRNGEDYGKPLSIDTIYADIVATMEAAKANKKASDRAFDSLIYKYNTDPGIFGKELGYAVNANLGDAEYDSSYMEEFSRAAKELFEAGVEGAISQPAVTDYGVHILYLSRIIPSNGLTVGLNDYVSYGERETVYEKIEETVRTEKVNNVFNVWQNNKIGYYQTEAKVIVRNESAFADLKESN